ncbi:hypothetical protein FJO69_00365 [[Mycoplasma] falconis]|uniref:DUF4064 domain-containing protein n=1 Tax=[Mycoplasma] falconis TaxID=92403 RepID=A0A501XBX0_9BACT|nr:hypothetical protein [[Mycoplasma] falconis]TPE58050.1 hypothetical protein FJO69_00365 [[Mycoplasma] falconis]
MNKKAIGVTGIIFSLFQFLSLGIFLGVFIFIVATTGHMPGSSEEAQKAVGLALAALGGITLILSIINGLILFILWILSIIVAFRDGITSAKITSLLALIPVISGLMAFITFCILVNSANKQVNYVNASNF